MILLFLMMLDMVFAHLICVNICLGIPGGILAYNL